MYIKEVIIIVVVVVVVALNHNFTYLKNNVYM